MTKPIIVARLMTPVPMESYDRIREFMAKQIGDECLLILIPSHVELHNLAEGHSIPAGHVIHEKTVYVQAPRKSMWAALKARFQARKSKTTATA